MSSLESAWLQPRIQLPTCVLRGLGPPSLQSSKSSEPWLPAGSLQLLRLMAKTGPVWGRLREPTAQALLVQLGTLLQVPALHLGVALLQYGVHGWSRCVRDS